MDQREYLRIPQADDIAKIMDLPLAVDEEIDSASQVATRYGFDKRQAEYYIEAAEILGLIRRQGDSLALSSDGRHFLKLDTSQRKTMLIKKILVLPIFSYIIAEMFANDTYAVSGEEISEMVVSFSGITGSTVKRRVHTLMAWLKWVGEETEVLEVVRESVKLLVAPKQTTF